MDVNCTGKAVPIFQMITFRPMNLAQKLFNLADSLLAAAFCSFLLLPVQVSAFELNGTKWLGARADFYVAIPGQSATQTTWNTATTEALNEWSAQTVFEFNVIEEDKDPCANDGFSSIDFTQNFCGSDFGANTLAVTVRRFAGQALGSPAIIEADVVVNAQEDFDIFDGPLVQFGKNFNGVDFKRVALHEFGHVIGLDHEESNAAIMAPRIGNLFTIQEDDIEGVKALYTGLSQCEVKALPFGTTTEQLSSGDCTVRELTVGGSDPSLLDIYRFEVNEASSLDFSVTSTELDTVLLLATLDLEYLEVEAQSTSDCDSEISTNLDQGTYLLIVNTFDQPIKPDCGVTGPYKLSSRFTSASRPSLGGNTSLLGTFNLAQYRGGITADNGQTYTNVFSPADSLDISAQISLDGLHIGKPGFIAVAVLLDSQILMLNEQGLFVDVGLDASPIVVHKRKILAATEQVEVAMDLVPAELGIEEIEANIVVGYGLDDRPEEIYFHRVPLNLTVQPAAGGGP